MWHVIHDSFGGGVPSMKISTKNQSVNELINYYKCDFLNIVLLNKYLANATFYESIISDERARRISLFVFEKICALDPHPVNSELFVLFSPSWI